MAITLTYQSTVIDLHKDLYWSDENTWLPVEQTVQRTTSGALIVSSAARVGGRPITLEPNDDDSAWMPESVLQQVRNLAVVPGRVMQLTLRGQTRNVIFRHHDGVAVEAVPVVHYSDVSGADWYRLTLRFMEF